MLVLNCFGAHFPRSPAHFLSCAQTVLKTTALQRFFKLGVSTDAFVRMMGNHPKRPSAVSTDAFVRMMGNSCATNN